MSDSALPPAGVHTPPTSTPSAESDYRPMTAEERAKWRIREDQCATLTTSRLPLDSACLLPLPCAMHPGYSPAQSPSDGDA